MDNYTRQRLHEISDGVLVEEDVLRVVDKIREIDPNLRIKYNPDPEAGITEAPYRITEICRDGIERIVFDVWELDDRIIQRIHQADVLKFDIAGQIDRNNALARRNKQKRFEEVKAEAKEIAGAIAKSPKDSYIVRDEYTGKKIKFTADERGSVEL